MDGCVEMKFRAWDLYHKHMIYQQEDLTASDILALSERECGNAGYKNYVVMRFTGLKDMYGTEIYEGDLVDTIATHASDPCRVRTVVSDSDCPGSLCFSPQSGASLCRTNERFFKVLGNIYEKKGLIDDVCTERSHSRF